MGKKDVFTPFSSSEKKIFLQNYLAHLRRRNGEIDLNSRRFSVREDFFRDVEENPVRRSGPPVVDQEVFERNEMVHKPEPGLDEATLWALAVAKSNRSEKFGVELALSRINQETRGPENPLTYIEIEEFYHTRVLKDALEVLGLEMRFILPHPITRTMVRAMVVSPKPFSNVMTFCSEIVGVAGFRLLADKAKELFADQPESLKRINELFQQILVDEVGHVHYMRSQLGPARLKIARKILPTLGRYLMSDMPEFEVLFGREKIRNAIIAADIEGATADYPDKLVPL